MTQLAQPPHPFLRGVDPSEPFDLMAYCLEVGKANYRMSLAIQAERDRSARYAEQVMEAVYSGKPIPVKPVALVVKVKKTLECHKGMTEKVLATLVEHGPLTAAQLRDKLGYYQVVPLLHNLASQKRVVREGAKGSHKATWKALT